MVTDVPHATYCKVFATVLTFQYCQRQCIRIYNTLHDCCSNKENNNIADKVGGDTNFNLHPDGMEMGKRTTKLNTSKTIFNWVEKLIG